MKYCLQIVFFIFLLNYSNANSQQIFINEGFESGSLPANWDQIPAKTSPSGTTINWKFVKGGFAYEPDTAAFGNKNARFDYQSYNKEATYLVTPSINLQGKNKPTLTFWHIQKTWMAGFPPIPYSDELKVFYKNTPGGAWHQLASYPAAIEDWIQQSILLPDSILTSTFFIGFMGITSYGFGTCIDQVKLAETASSPRNITFVKASHPNTDLVATGTNNNVILRLDLDVSGNTGNVVLNELNVKSANTIDSDIKTNGVKLYYSIDTFFNNAVLLGTPKSLVSGNAIFNNLNKLLVTGNNSIFITYDISESAQQANYIDATIEPSSISANESFYPSTVLNPTGKRIIVKSIFKDDFESLTGWTLNGDFQIDSIRGLGGNIGPKTFGTSDPEFAFNGKNALGNDISGLGIYPGNYELNQKQGDNEAISPTFDCYYYKDIKLKFQRHLSVYVFDTAAIYVSSDNGINWQKVWINANEGGTITDSKWVQKEFDLKLFLDRKPFSKIKFSLDTTGALNSSSGWNIDDLVVSGSFITKDASVTDILQPISNCGLTNHETVKVKVKNLGSQNIGPIIPLRYTLDGFNFIYDTLEQVLIPNQEVEFTFDKTVDLSISGNYLGAYAETLLPGDEDNRNNVFYEAVNALPYYHLPHFNNFENDNGYWEAGGVNETWQYGTPEGKSVITSPYSGQNFWVTELNRNYSPNDSSYIQSGCYDFSQTTKPIVDFYYKTDLEEGYDGVSLYYSVNNNNNWIKVLPHSYSWKGNWYNSDSIEVSDGYAWSGTTSGYLYARQALPDPVSSQNIVKFRFLIETDEGDIFEKDGFGFDNFRLYEAPQNLSIQSIDSITTACQGINPEKISFTIKNIGIRNVKPLKDTLIVGFKVARNGVQQHTIKIDTFILNQDLTPGSHKVLKFKKTADFSQPGSYSIQVINFDKNPNYYPYSESDTSTFSFIVYPNPVSYLPAIVRSAETDTISLIAKSDTGYLYKWNNNILLNTHIFDVDTAGKYWLNITAKDSTSCAITDTVLIQLLIPDITVDTFINPFSFCEHSPNEIVKISILNSGTDTLWNGRKFYTGFSFQGGAFVKDSFLINKKLKPGDTIHYKFPSSSLNLNAIQSYNLKGYAFFNKDKISTNDTVSFSIKTFGYPIADVGPDTIKEGFYDMKVKINPPHTIKSYLWPDNSTDTFYRVRSIGNQWVRITDENGCPDYDTAFVRVVIHDLKPTQLHSPISACSIENAIQFSVKYSNVGTDTITTVETLKIQYKIGNGNWRTDSITPIAIFKPGDTLIHQFPEIEDLSLKGDYNITIVTTLQGDIDKTNDTLRLTISNWGNPHVNLGNDTTLKALSLQLDGGTGDRVKYTWQNGSKSKNFNASESGIYYVEIKDSVHGCFDQDTIEVNLIIYDGQFTLRSGANVFCDGEYQTDYFWFKNNGNQVFDVGDSMIISYKVDQNSPILKTYYFNTFLGLGDSIEIEINNLNSNFEPGVRTAKFYPIVSDDLRNENDTLTTTIDINPLPNLNLSNGADTISMLYPFKLDGGEGNYSYQWNTDSTGRYLNIVNSGLYAVRTMDLDNLCEKSDTVFVNLRKPDIIATSANVPSKGCLGRVNSIQVEFTNQGNIVYKKGEKIQIGYRIENRTPFFVNVTLGQDLLNGGKLSYLFTGFSNKLDFGIQKIAFFHSIPEDIDRNNDTIVKNIEIFNTPYVALGDGFSDSIETLPPYQLYADNGENHTYIWSTNQTLPEIEVTQTGTYWVRITENISGIPCITSDTIYVFIKIPDIKVENIQSFSNRCSNEFDTLRVSFKNSGNQIIPFGSSFEIKTYIGSNLAKTQNLILNNTLDPGDSIVFYISELKSKISSGENVFSVKIKYSEDIVNINDSISQSITINPYPIVNLGSGFDSTTITQPLLLDGGSGSNLTYKWQDNSTNQTYNVLRSGVYHVFVRNSTTSCYNYDTIVVKANTTDLDITGFKDHLQTCMSDINGMKITVKNLGERTLFAGETVLMKYQINGTQYSQPHLVESDVITNSFFDISLSGMSQKLMIGNNTLIFEAITSTDIIEENNSENLSWNVNPHPVFDISGENKDSIRAYFPKTLDASAGDYSYLWNTGATSRTLDVNSNGTYSVVVIDNNNLCKGFDTVKVYRHIHDIQLVSVSLEKAEICLTDRVNALINIKNTGTDPIQTSEIITISYKIANGFSVPANFQTTTTINSGQSELFTVQNIGHSSFGIFSIDWEVSLNNDEDQLNNNNQGTISVLNTPVINWGDTNDTIKTEVAPYLIDPKTNTDYSYLWSNGSSLPTLNASVRGFYHLRVTDLSTSCYDHDTVYLLYKFDDIVVSSLSVKSVECQNDLNTFSFNVQNKGSELIPSGLTFKSGYILNNNTPVFADQLLSENFELDESKTQVFSGISSKLIQGTNTLKVFAKLNGDKNSANDTIEHSFTVNPSPNVELGDVIKFTPPRTLDAGAGYSKVEWNGTINSRTLVVNTEGWYWVKVTNFSGCTDIDSVFMDNLNTSIVASNIHQWKIEPNPVSGNQLILRNSQVEKDKYKIDLFNSDMTLLLSQRFDQINEHVVFDVSGFSRGIYLMIIANENDGKSVVIKWMKE